MKTSEAMRLIAEHQSQEQRRAISGYRVSFERVEGGMLVGDYVPDRDEDPIPLIEDAWAFATKFAAATYGQCINVYVVHAGNFTPVPGYEERRITNRSEAMGGDGWHH